MKAISVPRRKPRTRYVVVGRSARVVVVWERCRRPQNARRSR